MPNTYLSQVISNTQIADNVFSMTITCPDIASQALPGQFVHINCGHSRLLRRPISICSVSGDDVRIIYEIKGGGTIWLSKRREHEFINVLGPLGNGFDIPGGEIIVVGGGVGVPPMLFAALSATSSNKCAVTAIIGAPTADKIILQQEFEAVCHRVIVTTDDGSAGVHGFVTKPLARLLVGTSIGVYAAVLSCGPYAMQKSVAELCEGCGVTCQVSLEERMGCGVGACLVCACATKHDGNLSMSRVCADGPVFDAENVVW